MLKTARHKFLQWVMVGLVLTFMLGTPAARPIFAGECTVNTTTGC